MQTSIQIYIITGSLIVITLLFLCLIRIRNLRLLLRRQRIGERETEGRLRAAEAVLEAEELERLRIAKELHDGLGGMMSGIKYALNGIKAELDLPPEQAQQFERSVDMLDSSIKELRRISNYLMPEALLQFGLDAALRDLCKLINKSGALRLTYQSMGIDKEEIGQSASIVLYRIVQELVNNIMKHAAAGSAIVQVTRTNGQVSVTVEDDGRGFDVKGLSLSEGMGWKNIRHRVEYLKGKPDIFSEPGKGVSVLIELHL